jgi:uncharacterized membrane protein YeaQ/YmgE (transglycosylase-associated protein family)
VIGAAILGIVAGYLARALLPGKQEMGFFATVLLGLVGALVGFFFFTEVLGIGDTEIFDLGGLIGAVIGAMLVLFIYDRVVASRSAKSEPAAVGAGAGEIDSGREPRAERERPGRDRPERDRPRRDSPDR